MIPLGDDHRSIRAPLAVWIIVALTAAAFIWQRELSGFGQMRAFFVLGLTPAHIFGIRIPPPHLNDLPTVLTLATYLLLHGGWIHIIGNMMFLIAFGPTVEGATGPWRFTVVYLGTGALSGIAQALTDPTETAQIIGASGAVSGVIGAYLILFPHARLIILTPLFPFSFKRYRIRAVYFILAWVGVQIAMTVAAGAVFAGVAVAAHLAGFGSGMILILFLRRRGVKLWGGRRYPGPWGG